MTDTGPVLSVNGLTRRFGGITAINDLTLEVRSGEVLGVIGPNGAGKSTLVNLVGGALRPSSGTISIAGRDATTLSAPLRARLGVGRTHQIPRPFTRMSVLDNLLLAANNAPGRRRAPARRRGCMEILELTGLAQAAHTPAGELTLLRRKRLEMARALALKPRLLMLDEIGAGLVDSETRDLIGLIKLLRAQVESVLLIEHVMDVISNCCDRTAVLDFGRLIALGPTRQVLADSEVAAVYLGTVGTPDRVAVQAVDQSPPEPGPVVAARLDALAPGRSAQPTPGPLLSVNALSVNYGGLQALRSVDFHVGPAETVALLGANGAGKSTLARALAGTLAPASGGIAFAGRPLAGLRPDQVTAAGLAQCLEGRRIFGSLTVEENLVLGAGKADRATRRRRLEVVHDIFPVLAEHRSRPGTTLSGGQQQMLAIGRALMSAPRLLVFDEISLGLAPIAVDRLYEALAAIKRAGLAMIVVEQNIGRALALADRAYVLAQGRVALEGPSEYVREHPTLKSLYVGES